MQIDLCFVSNGRTRDLREMTANAIDSSRAPGVNVFVSEGYAGAWYRAAHVFRQPRPFNYNRCLNDLIGRGKGEIVGLMNNDVIFRPEWDTEIRALLKNPAIGSVSPWCKYSHPGFYAARREDLPRVIHGYEIRKHVAGWAIFVRRDVLDKIGPLPEHVDFWYSDNAYADQLKAHGIGHVLSTRARVDHLESRTLKTQNESEINRLTWAQLSKYEKGKGK